MMAYIEVEMIEEFFEQRNEEGCILDVGLSSQFPNGSLRITIHY